MLPYLSPVDDPRDCCDWWPCAEDATNEVILSAQTRLVEGRYCDTHSDLALADVKLEHS